MSSPLPGGSASAARPRTRLRVLVAGHSYLAGVNQQKLETLSRYCESVAVLVPANWKYRGGLFAGERVPPACHRSGFRMLAAPVARPDHLASFVFGPVSLMRLLAEAPGEVVHIDQEVYSLAAAQLTLAAKAAGRKAVVFGWENLDRPLHPAQRGARRMVLGLADAIVTGSGESAALVRKWGYGGPVAVIPQLGVDASLFRPAHRRQPGPARIGYLGRLVPEKGVDVLLDAAAILAAAQKEFRLVICGSGPAAKELKRQVCGLGLEGAVDWQSAVPHEQAPAVLRALDVLVLPSRATDRWKEQFGHVLIEAMAAGVAVAGSRSGAIPEVIGREDLIFDEGDAAALAAVLERLIGDGEWRRQAAAYGIARVRERYTHERIAEQLVALWEEIC